MAEAKEVVVVTPSEARTEGCRMVEEGTSHEEATSQSEQSEDFDEDDLERDEDEESDSGRRRQNATEDEGSEDQDENDDNILEVLASTPGDTRESPKV